MTSRSVDSVNLLHDLLVSSIRGVCARLFFFFFLCFLFFRTGYVPNSKMCVVFLAYWISTNCNKNLKYTLCGTPLEPGKRCHHRSASFVASEGVNNLHRVHCYTHRLWLCIPCCGVSYAASRPKDVVESRVSRVPSCGVPWNPVPGVPWILRPAQKMPRSPACKGSRPWVPSPAQNMP